MTRALTEFLSYAVFHALGPLPMAPMRDSDRSGL
jgi:hypothetical protein